VDRAPNAARVKRAARVPRPPTRRATALDQKNAAKTRGIARPAPPDARV